MLLYHGKKNKFYNKNDRARKNSIYSTKYRQGNRDEFERDYGRIIHSSAFRRLQGKTQVINPSEGDIHRTRLTHTLEVSQIARGISINLNENSKYLKEENQKIDLSLIEAAALAHDLGHPPFGHKGERALNKCMNKVNLGFEGNAHTFRILTRLEKTGDVGINLTRGTLLATLKYPILFKDALDRNVDISKVVLKPPKASIFEEDAETYEWLLEDFDNKERSYLTKTKNGSKKKGHLKTEHKTFECSIVELADDIAYATHDLEDALALGLITLENFLEVIDEFKVKSKDLKIIVKKSIELDKSKSEYKVKLKELFADIINMLMKSIKIKENNKLTSPRVRYEAVLPDVNKDLIDKLNDLIYDQVILSQRVQTIEWKGKHIIEKLFDAISNDVKLLPQDKRNRIGNENNESRVVCDYIAGMTDSYAQNMYSRLYEPIGSKLFDI